MGNAYDELRKVMGMGDDAGTVKPRSAAPIPDESLWDKLTNAPLNGGAELTVAEAEQLVGYATQLRRAIRYNAGACSDSVHEEMLRDPGKAFEFAINNFKNRGK